MRAVFPAISRPRALGVLGIVALLGGCESGGAPTSLDASPRADDPGAALGDGVSVDGMRYPLTAAIGEIWGRSSAWPTHFNVDYLLTNGRFAVTPIVVDGESASVREPVEASVELRAELYAPAAESLPFADYVFATDPDAPGAIDGRHFFTAARLGTDTDGSGDVERDEMREVIGGTIAFAGPLDALSLTFSLVLEDGTTANGSYRGLFEFIQRD